jgi:hypothetical protein
MTIKDLHKVAGKKPDEASIFPTFAARPAEGTHHPDRAGNATKSEDLRHFVM